MGQSAGGAAVDYYAYAHLHDPIVAGLISHSGTAHSWPANTPQFAGSSFLTAAASLGCSGSSVVTCMRAQPFQAVLNATTKVKPLPAALLPQPVFYPTVDNSRLHDRGLVGLNIAYIVSGLGWNIGIYVLYRGGSLLGSSISS